jgi:hypothetical protein
MIHLRHAKRTVIAGALLGLGLLAGPLTAHRVSAGLITCELDPTVYLSNGRVVTLAAHISSDLSTVTQVNYDLHVPYNVSVVNVAYDGFGSVENLTVTADNSHHRYTDTMTVTTNTGTPVQVTSHLDVSGQHSSDVSGWSGQPIAVSVWVPGIP